MVPNRLPSFWCGGRAVAPSGCRMSVPRTVRALWSHAPPLRAAARLRMAVVSEAASSILQMRRRVLSGLRGRRPAQGEADHKLLHAWAWGTEPQPISLGQLQCLPAEHIGRATSLRKTQNRTSAQAKAITTTSACSSASNNSPKRLSNYELSEHQRSHTATAATAHHRAL